MQVFYTPAKNGVMPQIIDIAITGEDGQTLGQYSGQTPEQITARYPGALLGDSEAVTLEREGIMRTMPTRITEEQYWDALEVLPPEGWTRTHLGESFKLCEYLCGRMTHIYAKVQDEYWEFCDVGSMPHVEIMAKVLMTSMKITMDEIDALSSAG